MTNVDVLNTRNMNVLQALVLYLVGGQSTSSLNMFLNYYTSRYVAA
jgi:hypothetical protein